MTEGHAQELKTQALALQVGKRLRILLSDNNAGIDECCWAGSWTANMTATTRRPMDVLWLERLDAGEWQRLRQVVAALRRWRIGIARPPSDDRDRPDDQRILARGAQTARFRAAAIKSSAIQPSVRAEDEFGILRRAGETFERKVRRDFPGIRDGAVTDPRERLIQFKTNIDVVMSVLDRNGLGDWLADRLVAIGDTVKDDFKLQIDVKHDPFLDDRLRVANLPVEPQKVTVNNRVSGAEKAGSDCAVPQTG